MNDIAVYCAGGLGREILTLIKDINVVCPSWNVLGFFDDRHPRGGDSKRS